VGKTPLVGDVTFTPQFPLHRPAALAVTHSPPAAIVPRVFLAVIDVDGVLRPKRGGANGVRLWANDPVLQLENLVYRVTFENVTDLVGNPVAVQGGTFYAPSTDQIVLLTTILGIPGSKVSTGLAARIDGGTPRNVNVERADGGTL
jgi:hypothetical protein